MDFRGKVALVTGASRGIGKSVALTLASLGATVALVSRNAELLEHVAKEIIENGYPTPDIFSYSVDDLEETKKTFGYLNKKYKRLDVLVNNAGILEEKLLGMITNEHIDATYAVNVKSSIFHMQLASRLMARNRCGSIVNVSSIIGTRGRSGLLAYSASKAAIIGATLSAAKELAHVNIRVNAVAPGFIDTDMTKKLSNEMYVERLSGIKMNRAGTAQEVANVIAFLASDLSSYVTGQVIGVDGGMIE